MGADLCIEYAVFDENTNFEEKEKELLQAVNDLTVDDLQYIRDFYSELSGEEDEVVLDDAKTDFMDYIKEFFVGINKGYRDITWITHKGETLFITGGMSWGDDPTDSYNTFRRFNLILELFERKKERKNATNTL